MISCCRGGSTYFPCASGSSWRWCDSVGTHVRSRNRNGLVEGTVERKQLSHSRNSKDVASMLLRRRIQFIHVTNRRMRPKSGCWAQNRSSTRLRRYLGIVDAQTPGDPDAVDDWLDGYIVELILSMETWHLHGGNRVLFFVMLVKARHSGMFWHGSRPYFGEKLYEYVCKLPISGKYFPLCSEAAVWEALSLIESQSSPLELTQEIILVSFRVPPKLSRKILFAPRQHVRRVFTRNGLSFTCRLS